MSIFDPSFHSSKKKIKQEPAKVTPISKNLPDPQFKSEDVRELFSQMYHKHEELNIKIDKVYQLSGKDPSEVEEYFNDPTHFKPYDWERMQERQDALEENLMGVPKAELKKKKIKKHVSKMSKERKGKTLGARKNWLSMR